MVKRIAVCAGVCAALAVGAAPASAAFPSVVVEGTNGYSVAVSGFFRGDLAVDVFAARRVGASYIPKTSHASRKRMTADLGELGTIDLAFQKEGNAEVEQVRGRCHGTSIHRHGTWVGTLEFHGEGGYTDVSLTSAPGGVQINHIRCNKHPHGPPPGGPQRETVFLDVHGGPGDPTFSAARVNDHTYFGASVERETPELEAYYFASRRTDTDSFRVTRHKAIVRPPAPFTGSAIFDGKEKQPGRWTGDLAVELPVVGTVALTGPQFKAELFHGGWVSLAVGVAARSALWAR